MLLVDLTELSLLTGIPVYKLKKLERQGVISQVRDEEDYTTLPGFEDIGPDSLITIKQLSELSELSIRRLWQLQQEGVIKPVPEEYPGQRNKEGAKFPVLETTRSLIDYWRCGLE